MTRGEFEYITKYDNHISPIYTDKAVLQALTQLKREVSALKEDTEIKYGYQLMSDKIDAYNHCLDLIDKKISKYNKDN